MAGKTKYVTEALEPRLLLAGAVLVKDIIPDTLASSPSAGLTLGSRTFFAADDGITGRELWATDGSAAGTTLVKDIRSGASGSNPFLLGIVNNALFFTADNGVNGTELWRSDGTASGTSLFRDFQAGSASSSISRFQNLNGVSYFQVSGFLWKTDGTAQGTVLVDNSFAYGSLTVANNSLYFIARTADTGDEVWRSDGTAAGKVLLDVNPGPSTANPSMLTVANGEVYFRAYDAAGSALWKTDGTPDGTVKVRPIQDIQSLTSLNDVVLFKGYTDAARLWRSDGTPDGTYPISDVAPGNGSVTAPFEKANGMIFYSAGVGGAQEGQDGLWKSDGTAVGTGILVTSDVPGSIGGIKAVGDNVYFVFGRSGTVALWKSDGTVDGTVLVSSPFRQIGGPIAQLGPQTLYSLADHRGLELWKTDGTAAGTSIVKDINSTPISSDPKVITNVNGTLFFTAADAVWKSDGTDTGTVMLKALPTQQGSITSERDVGVNLNGQFIFTANMQLWRSDGTPQGTVLLKSNLPSTTIELFAADGYALYAGTLANGNIELWRTDGTPQGTVLLMDLPGSTNYPSLFTAFKGSVYFTANRSANTVLWKTDGSAQGTVQVHPSIRFTGPVIYKDSLWFSGCDTATGCEPWTIDHNGAVARFMEIRNGSGTSNPRDFVVSNNYLYFTADASNGTMLYKSDGTVTETRPLVQSLGSPMIDVNGTLFFAGGTIRRYNGSVFGSASGFSGTLVAFRAADGLLFQTNTNALYVSDGSTAGTFKLLDYPASTFGATTLYLATLNNEVYFRAIDPVYGSELFKLPAPTARSANPYNIGRGFNLTLDASASSDPDPTKTLSFAWDLDNDGIFGETGAAAAMGDEVGANATFRTANAPNFINQVSLRVTSSSGLSSQLSTTVFVRYGRMFSTPGNDVFRVTLNGDQVDYYENAPLGGGPTFSIPTSFTPLIFVDPSDGDDVLSVDFRAALTYNGGAGKDTLTITGGDWSMGPASIVGVANFVLGNTASFLSHLTQRFDSMTLRDSAKAKIDVDGTVLHLGSLSIQGNATLDIADKPLIVDNASISDINALIKAHSIFSSSNLLGRVVGAIINSNGAGGPLYSTFGGENLTGGEILVRYTTNGDMNLDNQVSISDFIDLAAHIGQSPATWQDGDLNGDDAVSIADFIILSSSFEQGSAVAGTPEAALSSNSVTSKHRRAGSHHRLQRHKRQIQLVLLAKGWAEKR